MLPSTKQKGQRFHKFESVKQNSHNKWNYLQHNCKELLTYFNAKVTVASGKTILDIANASGKKMASGKYSNTKSRKRYQNNRRRRARKAKTKQMRAAREQTITDQLLHGSESTVPQTRTPSPQRTIVHHKNYSSQYTKNNSSNQFIGEPYDSGDDYLCHKELAQS